MLPYKQSYFRMTYENKFCYRLIYRIIFESIVFTYYIKSNYWHADNWHGGQLACGKLAWRTICIDFFNCFLFNYFNVLTNNKFQFQIIGRTFCFVEISLCSLVLRLFVRL